MWCECVGLIVGQVATGRVASAEEKDAVSTVSPIQVEPGDWPWGRGGENESPGLSHAEVPDLLRRLPLAVALATRVFERGRSVEP